ncbi:MAG: hypothetical protein HY648_10030 [Acidobacteria bacterium]|nr:hypothetical protein [Acidobacteriota bacterium]
MFEIIPRIDPQAQRRRRRWIFGVVFSLLCAAYIYYELRHYPEERQAHLFFDALEQQDYQRAYQLWKPTSSYTFKDFLEDWGPERMDGPVRQFQIQDSETGGTGVTVLVVINSNEPLALWVEKKDKSLSFSPVDRPVDLLSLLLPSSLAKLWVERSRRRLMVPLFLALLLAGYMYYESRKSARETLNLSEPAG